jgi:hypothetical protein
MQVPKRAHATSLTKKKNSLGKTDDRKFFGNVTKISSMDKPYDFFI